jgi:multiple sugar transport system permease protein
MQGSYTSSQALLKRRLSNTFEFLAVTLLVLVLFVPILWIILTSFKIAADTYNLSFTFTPTLGNYRLLFQEPYNFGKQIYNSVKVVVVSLLIAIPLSTFAAYALSRFKIVGKQPILFLILSTQFLPPVLLVLPFFLLFKNLNLIDTTAGLIIINVARAIPFAIWLIKGFIDGIPTDIEQAAMIDGCNRFQVLWHIILPMTIPGVLTATVFNFIIIWNEFLYVLVLGRSNASTLPLSLMLFRGERGVIWNEMAAGGVLLVIPAVIVMLFARKYFVKGITLGAID